MLDVHIAERVQPVEIRTVILQMKIGFFRIDFGGRRNDFDLFLKMDDAVLFDVIHNSGIHGNRTILRFAASAEWIQRILFCLRLRL